MCGIAGWVSYDGDLTSHKDVITTMTKTMARRGPDAGGVWIDRHVGFGHRRLAVIDLAGGVQPMQPEELGQTTVSLIDTGEVYNFVELRDDRSPKSKHIGDSNSMGGNDDCLASGHTLIAKKEFQTSYSKSQK